MEEVTRPLEQIDGEITAQNVLAILARRKWLFLQIAGGVLLVFAIFGATRPPVFEASAWMLLSPPETPSKDAMLAKTSLFSSQQSEMTIHIKLLHRVEMIQKVISELDVNMKPRQFLQAATISEVAHSSGNLLSISFEDTDPAFAAKVVNLWANLYEDDSSKRSTASTMAAIAYVEEQLEDVETDLRDTGEQNATIEQQNLETGIAGGSVVSVEQYAELLAELGTVQAEEAAVQAQLTRMQQLVADEPEDLEEVEKHPSIKAETIEEQIAELNIELQRMLKDYYEDSPEVKAVREHIARLRKQLESDADLTRSIVTSSPNPNKISARDAVLQLSGQLDGIRARKHVITRQVARQRELANLAPTLGVEYAALKRKALGLEQVHGELLSRLYQLRLQAAMAVPPIRLVQTAEVPDTPVAPHLTSIMGVGLILGLILALIISLTVDYCDDTFANIEEISSTVHCRVLGAIPEDGNVQTPISLDDRSPYSNAVRAVASVIRLQVQRNGLSSFAIASSGDSEGKSTVAANIAVVLARAGMGVLLVDSDMYKPAQHHIFHVDNSTGFASLVTEQGVLDDVISDTAEPNLRIIPAGSVLSTYVDSVGDPLMADVAGLINESAEVVIWDTLADGIVPDAALIASQAQATVFVIGRRTKRKAAVRTLRALRDSGAHVLGVVANGVRTIDSSYSHTDSQGEMAKKRHLLK